MVQVYEMAWQKIHGLQRGGCRAVISVHIKVTQPEITTLRRMLKATYRGSVTDMQ